MIDTIWPLQTRPSLADRVAFALKKMPGFCNLCGRFSVFDTEQKNFREHVRCGHCGSSNRQRQLVAVLLSWALRDGGQPPLLASVGDLPTGLVVWNAESARALHDRLSRRLGGNYVSSEYIDSGLRSGEVRDGVLHVDIQHSHFADDSLDFILSSDVLEHVPFVDRALRETYRVLKPGGCHIFTVPFYQHRFTTERRARVGAEGRIEHHCRPWFHDDPLREEGVLVYNVFAPELLCELENVGFEARLLRLHSPFHGIYGQNGIVLLARKAIPPAHQLDFIFGNADA